VPVDASLLQFFKHEAAEQIIAADTDKGHLQTQARRSAREYRGGRSDGEYGGIDELFDLAEFRLHVARQNQVWIEFSCDENIKHGCLVGYGFSGHSHDVASELRQVLFVLRE